MTITGPGDDDTQRLVMTVGVVPGNAMKIETGENVELFFLEVVSRSLGSADELETRSLGFNTQQLADLAEQIIKVVLRQPEA